MTDREQFEDWAKEWGLPLIRGFYADRYEAISTNYAWDAWQAARRADLEQAWIPVSERLPEERQRVLISNDEMIEIAQLLPAEEDQVDQPGCDAGFFGEYARPGRSFGNPEWRYEPQGQPTHWMPIPAAPQRSERK